VEFHQNRYASALETAAYPGCRWLDLGAGARLHGGWLGRSAEAVTSQASCVVGCDMVIPHLRRHPNLSHRVGATGDQLPFADHAFDLVTANMVLEHLLQPTRVFREVARVLAPGGRFVFVTPHLGHPVVRAMSILLHPRMRIWVAHFVEGRKLEHIFQTFYRANTVPQIERLAGEAGLAIRRLERFSSFPMTKRIPGVRRMEQWWINRIEARWGACLRSNLLGVLETAQPVILPAGHSRTRPGEAILESHAIPRQ
jgi:ubiquinone/menaquinone biosynthesis C-methylase UbiE